MVSHALAISGAIGSGKSTVAFALAQTGDYHYVSFGDYLRHLCELQSLEGTRENLQSLGQDCIARGWGFFVSDVLSYSQWNFKESVVIDGVRHIEALISLRQAISPIPLTHVHLSADEGVIEHRINVRGREWAGDRQTVLRHESESHQIALSDTAELCIQNLDDISLVLDGIQHFIRGKFS